MPIPSFEAELTAQLDELRALGLHRELRRVGSPQGPALMVDGRPLLSFSSNDYLGLANHPVLKEAAARAALDFGAGSGASRLICGSLEPHHELEETLASFKGTEAALVFSTGYAAAAGTIGALLDREDVVVVDRLVHACVVDAARLSGARLRVFAHNDLDDLEGILRWASARLRPATPGSSSRKPRLLVVTESVFSMDGDMAPLRALVELKEKYGAWLMLDEAHATGLHGPRRRGLAEANAGGGPIEIQMGTLGKALGASGGYVCGSRPLIQLLVNRARSFIFSTAPVPAAAAAATAGIRLVQSAEGEARVRELWRRVDQARAGLAGLGWPVPGDRCAILPLPVGDEGKAMELSASLRAGGVFVPAIRYPTVGRGEARLRLTVTAAHTPDQVAELITQLPGPSA